MGSAKRQQLLHLFTLCCDTILVRRLNTHRAAQFCGSLALHQSDDLRLVHHFQGEGVGTEQDHLVAPEDALNRGLGGCVEEALDGRLQFPLQGGGN